MIRDIDQGRIMVVTDLHGNGYDYRQIIDVYRNLKEANSVDYLVFVGDLIHSYPGQKDESVAIVEDLMERGANQEDSDIICLLGNHEFVHIYHIALAKGHLEFTSWFERRIVKKRKKFIDFFQAMPLAVRTKGGVLIHHTGASEIYSPQSKIFQDFQVLKEYSHTESLNGLKHIKSDLNPFGKYDTTVGQTFMQTLEGDWFWEMLMNGNERQYGPAYPQMVNQMLDYMSSDRQGLPLRVMVTGHIGVDYGAEVVTEGQLRLCSSAGCLGDLEKKILLFPAEKGIESASQLIEYCRDLY
ncbi:MAG: metallophosphoesterase [Marinifilaceae bacterium]